MVELYRLSIDIQEPSRLPLNLHHRYLSPGQFGWQVHHLEQTTKVAAGNAETVLAT
jgi:hypothetical protein